MRLLQAFATTSVVLQQPSVWAEIGRLLQQKPNPCNNLKAERNQWFGIGYSNRERYTFMSKNNISSTCASTDKNPASEKMLQTHSVSALAKLILAGHPILYAGDMAGNRRTRSEQLWAKSTGLVRGEPDLRVYGPKGRTLLIEWKTSIGTVSAEQATRHEKLRKMGHRVVVLRAKTGPEAFAITTATVLNWLAEGDRA